MKERRKKRGKWSLMEFNSIGGVKRGKPAGETMPVGAQIQQGVAAIGL